jgi:hypothetical protein
MNYECEGLGGCEEFGNMKEGLGWFGIREFSFCWKRKTFFLPSIATG